MLSVTYKPCVLSVIMLNVIMLSVVAPKNICTRGLYFKIFEGTKLFIKLECLSMSVPLILV
jgi:hypothetical protein